MLLCKRLHEKCKGFESRPSRSFLSQLFLQKTRVLLQFVTPPKRSDSHLYYNVNTFTVIAATILRAG